MADVKKSNKKSLTDNALEALSLPQKILMQKTAKAIGANESADSDAVSEAITEKVAEKLGIESPLAKAGIKTALDFGYDPLNVVGVGAIAKVAKGAKGTRVVENALSKLNKSRLAKEPELAKIAENYWKSQKASAQAIRQGLRESEEIAAKQPRLSPEEIKRMINKEKEVVASAKEESMIKRAPVEERNKFALETATARAEQDVKDIKAKKATGELPEDTQVISEIIAKVKKKKGE